MTFYKEHNFCVSKIGNFDTVTRFLFHRLKLFLSSTKRLKHMKAWLVPLETALFFLQARPTININGKFYGGHVSTHAIILAIVKLQMR